MKYEKLKEIVKKEKRFEYLGLGALLLLMIGTMLLLCNVYTSGTRVLSTLTISTIALIISAIVLIPLGSSFINKSSRYRKVAYDYICIKTMDIIAQNGIKAEGFKIIEEAHTGVQYIAFHNQQVDYEKLRHEINEALNEMNRIAKRDIRMELI